MEHQPFSVAISVYRNDIPAYFDRALESITDQQTVKPDEIVLVVDGPVPDEINAVIDKYSKKYNLKVIRLETNGGLGNALKIATENCSNELIARMDSDDVSSPSRFEEQLSFFGNNPDIDVVGGDISEFIGEESNVVAIRKVPSNNSQIRKYMKKRCAMNPVSTMFKKSSLISIGGYQDWYCNEDYFLWIRMWLNDAVFANTGSVLVNVRTGTDMYARRGGRQYFQSEKKLQKFMYKHKMISFPLYFINVAKRFIVQRLMTNSMRGHFYRKYARKR